VSAGAPEAVTPGPQIVLRLVELPKGHCAWCGQAFPLAALERVTAVRPHSHRENLWSLLRCKPCGGKTG